MGTGGGKAIDTARVVAEKTKLPLITIPTSAATCSAASAVAVLYERGVRQATVNGKGAELVLVDSSIIAQAPVRLLTAGMGDALANGMKESQVMNGHRTTMIRLRRGR